MSNEKRLDVQGRTMDVMSERLDLVNKGLEKLEEKVKEQAKRGRVLQDQVLRFAIAFDEALDEMAKMQRRLDRLEAKS